MHMVILQQNDSLDKIILHPQIPRLSASTHTPTAIQQQNSQIKIILHHQIPRLPALTHTPTVTQQQNSRVKHVLLPEPLALHPVRQRLAVHRPASQASQVAPVPKVLRLATCLQKSKRLCLAAMSHLVSLPEPLLKERSILL